MSFRADITLARKIRTLTRRASEVLPRWRVGLVSFFSAGVMPDSFSAIVRSSRKGTSPRCSVHDRQHNPPHPPSKGTIMFRRFLLGASLALTLALSLAQSATVQAHPPTVDYASTFEVS